jgi:hypothetical protein
MQQKGALHPKRLSKMPAAIAALAGALSVGIGVLAARFAPHGHAALPSRCIWPANR